MTMEEEHQVRIRGLADNIGTLRQLRDVPPRPHPECQTRAAGHEHGPQRLARAGEMEEVNWLKVREDLRESS